MKTVEKPQEIVQVAEIEPPDCHIGWWPPGQVDQVAVCATPPPFLEMALDALDIDYSSHPDAPCKPCPICFGLLGVTHP